MHRYGLWRSSAIPSLESERVSQTPERALAPRRHSHARFDWTLTQRSRLRVSVHWTNQAYPKTCPTAILSRAIALSC